MLVTETDKELSSISQFPVAEKGFKHPILTLPQEFWVFSALRRRNEHIEQLFPPPEGEDKKLYLLQNFRENIVEPDFRALIVKEPPKLDQRPGFAELIPKCESLEDLIIGCNQGLVYGIAKKYLWSGMELDDLVGEGNFGLLHALRNFDESRGLKFSTMTTWWVKQKINLAVMNNKDPIRIPVYLNQLISKAGGISKRILMISGQEATPEELGAALVSECGISKERALKAAEMYIFGLAKVISLDKPIYRGQNHDTGTSTLKDFLKSPLNEVEGMIDIIDGSLAVSMTREILTERDFRILLLRSVGNQSLDQIGGIFEITRERVRQLERRIIKKLRTHRQLQELYSSLPSYVFCMSAEMAAIKMGLFDQIGSNVNISSDTVDKSQEDISPLPNEAITSSEDLKKTTMADNGNKIQSKEHSGKPKPDKPRRLSISFDGVGSIKEAIERAKIAKSQKS